MGTAVETPRAPQGRLTEDELLTALPARSANREVRVGIFVLVGLVAFLAALFTFTDVGTFRGRYYAHTVVEDAGGMRRGDPVQMRGVNIGRVVGFDMVPGGVRVRLELYNEYEVPEGSQVMVKSSGLLGGMVVDVVPGASDERIESGAILPGVAEQGLMSAAGGLTVQADSVLTRANALLSRQTVGAVGQSALELQALLAELSALASQQRQELAALSNSLQRSAAGVERATTGGELERAAQNIDQLTARLDETTQSLGRASGSLETVLARLERGEGTLGRLSVDDELYVNLNSAVANLNQLVADIRADPKKFLSVSVF
jgi:phospholipid/cholesterol/gamma-HCH transport system substrate-binding protein